MKKLLKRIKPVSVVWWLILLLVVAGIVVLAINKPEKEAVEEIESPPVLVSTMIVEPNTVRETVLLQGRVKAHVTATLAAEKSGRVVACPVDKGDTVTKGQVLLQLDDRHWRSIEQQARLELVDAQRERVRWEQMKTSGAVADSDFDAIKHRQELAQVAMDEAVVHVNQCTLRSPFDGVVDQRMIEVGEYINEGQSAFVVLQVSPLKVEIGVPERDIGAIRVGEMKRIDASSAGLGDYKGKVTFVAQEASDDRFTYPAELTIEAEGTSLRPGMIVDVEVTRAIHHNAIQVPLSAVIPIRGEHVVFVVEDNVAIRRVIALRSISGHQAVIGSGLRTGEQLVVAGHRGLQDGVIVQEDEE